jgi:hypothetical protein
MTHREGIQASSNEVDASSPRGDNSKEKNTENCFKIFFRASQPISNFEQTILG